MTEVASNVEDMNFRHIVHQIVELEDDIRTCPAEYSDALDDAVQELHVLYEQLMGLWPVQENCGSQEEENFGHNQGSD